MTPMPPKNDPDRLLLVEALRAAGIWRLSAEFDGEGDSGQVGEIWARNSADKLMPLPVHLLDRIHNTFDDLLGDTVPGWENEDGAYGEFLWFLGPEEGPKGRIELVVNTRCMTVDTEEYEL